jgi:hypothetical protein
MVMADQPHPFKGLITLSTEGHHVDLDTYTFGTPEAYRAILDHMDNSQEHYFMALNYEDFRAVLLGLRELSIHDTASEEIRERANSVITSIAESLGVELI